MAELQPTYRKGITFGARRSVGDDSSNGDETNVIKDIFPEQRTLLLVPNDESVPKGKKVDIVVTEEVLLATANHVAQDTSKESGGFLLGNRYECPTTNRQYIVVDQFMKADYTEGTQVSLTFTAESWAQLKDRQLGKFRGKALVGWYHSHPGMGIFLSNYDLEIHKGNYFNKDWQVALVLDPIKHEGGFFGFVDGNLSPREKFEFYELLEGESRETVVSWANYVAEDPKTGTLAPLKFVNTQNFDGTTSTNAPKPTPKTQTVSSDNLLSNPLILIGGLASIGIFVFGTIFATYWLFFRTSENTNTNTATENQTVVNKVLDAKRTAISKKPEDLKAYISSDNKLRVEIKILDLGAPEVLDEVKKPENLTVTINSKQANIEETNVENGSILLLRAVSELSEEESQAFKKGTAQDLEMVVDIRYLSDSVSRQVNAKYSKGSGSNKSLGDVVKLSDPSDVDVTQTRPRPKPQTSDNNPPVQEKPVQEKPQPNVKQQTKTTQQKTTSTQQQQGQGTTGTESLDSSKPRPQPTRSQRQQPTTRTGPEKQGGTGQSSLDQD
jgi:proteasome lid subunit RPN8/RPN11